MKWLHRVQKYLKEINISEEVIQNRNLLKKILGNENVRFQTVQKKIIENTQNNEGKNIS